MEHHQQQQQQRRRRRRRGREGEIEIQQIKTAIAKGDGSLEGGRRIVRDAVKSVMAKGRTRVAMKILIDVGAPLEATFRQWKSAGQVYSQAATLCNGVAEPWIAYARFYYERKKMGKARKVFLRSLQILQEQDEKVRVWSSFLKMENWSREIKLSMEELKELIRQTEAPVQVLDSQNFEQLLSERLERAERAAKSSIL